MENNLLSQGLARSFSISKDNGIVKGIGFGHRLQTDNKTYKLAAFQNVNEALDETKLKRGKILQCDDHEIMNSGVRRFLPADTMLDIGCRKPPNSC